MHVQFSIYLIKSLGGGMPGNTQAKEGLSPWSMNFHIRARKIGFDFLISPKGQ
jgi:hypothetical protein